MLQFLIYFAEYFDIVWWITSYNLFHLYLLKANLLSDDFFLFGDGINLFQNLILFICFV